MSLKSCMLASFMTAISLFSQDCCAKSPLPVQMSPEKCCPDWPVPILNAAYNYPAYTQTRCPWGMFIDMSFLYWQPIIHGLDLGARGPSPFVAGTFVGGINAQVVNMNFDFKPGFKVGLGSYFDYDHWDLHLEYTWFHNTHSKQAKGPLIHSRYNGVDVFDSVSRSWDLKLDILDLDLGRIFYVGTELTFHPSFGVRADWIRQKIHSSSERANGSYGLGANILSTVIKKNSWAIGPKIELDTNWHLGSGFKLFGTAEADLLFTDYTTNSLDYSQTARPLYDLIVKQKALYALRPHCDLEVGFGWGTYFNCHKWYLNLDLGYEFQLFWDQNGFQGYSLAPDPELSRNLYINGLTATIQLDF